MCSLTTERVLKQGAIRTAVWAFCQQLAEEHLEAAMVLYDTLIKDCAHEPHHPANVGAAAAVRARHKYSNRMCSR